MKKLGRQLYKAVTHDLVGGLLREARRQIFGGKETKKKKQSGSVHYHYHDNKKHYKPWK